MSLIFLFFSIFIICTHLFPLLSSTLWFVRAFDFPRIQVMILTVLYLIMSVIYIDHIGSIIAILIGCIACFALDFYRIGPYFPISKKESKSIKNHSDVDFRLYSSNVFVNNLDYHRLVDSVKKANPDVVALIEPDSKWEEGASELKKVYKYHELVPKDNTYGILLYSKFKLVDTEVKYLVDKNVPSIFTKIEIPDRGLVELICVHPRPPRPNESSSLQRDAELINVAKYVRERHEQSILVFGDLNDVAWSHSTRLFKRISKTLDPRVGRGFFNTFPVKWPFLRVPLDHIFHTPRLSLGELRVLPSIGSDHFPIYASFTILDEFSKSGIPEKEDKNDIEEAKEILEKGKTYDGPEEEVKKEDE